MTMMDDDDMIVMMLMRRWFERHGRLLVLS